MKEMRVVWIESDMKEKEHSLAIWQLVSDISILMLASSLDMNT